MDNIRITSGNLRGRTICSPKSEQTHPMGAREKLALFNMIASELSGATVLDAFAGSGAVGIEAMSRGAKKVVFVEKNPKTAGIIRKNLANLGIDANVVIGDVAKFESDERFDIIIADPPYDNFEVQAVAYLTKYLKDGGVLVLSHPNEPPVIDDLKLTTSRKYAGATLSIYRK